MLGGVRDEQWYAEFILDKLEEEKGSLSSAPGEAEVGAAAST